MSENECPMIIRDVADGGFVWVNLPFSERLGWSSGDLGDKPLGEWIDASDQTSFQTLLRDGRGRLRAGHRSRDGDPVHIDWEIRSESHGLVALGVLAEGDQPPDVVRDPVTASSLPPPIEGDTLGDTLQEMALVLEAQHPGRRCSILLLDHERRAVSVGAGPSLPTTYNEAVEGLQIGPFVGSCGTAAYWNRPVYVNDIQGEALWRDLKDHARDAGVAACWSHPIRSRAGHVLGALALYSPTKAEPTPHERSSLDLTANMVALAIERGRAERALQASETALQESESRFRSTFENAHVGIAHVSPEGTWLRVNTYFCELLGYSARELARLSVQESTHPDDQDAAEDALARALRGDVENFTMDARFQRKDGTLVWGSVTARLMREANGDPKHFILVCKDISRRKQAISLVELQSSVLESIARGADLKATLDQLCRQVETQLADARCMVLLRSESGDTLHAASGPNMPDEILTAMDGIEIASTLGTCGAAVLLERQMITPDVEADPAWAENLSLTRKFGVRASWSTPLRSQTGSVLGTLSACHMSPALPSEYQRKLIETASRLAGIASERSRQDDALRRAQKLESLGLMAGGIAHDFNNLLVAMLGQSALALAKAPKDDASRTHIEKAIRAAERAAELTNELLAYSGRGHFEFRQINLNEAIRDNLHIFDVAIPKSVTITTDLDTDLPTIEADAGQIQQVLMNLIINAAESLGTSAGEVAIRTRTVSLEEGDPRYGQYIEEPLADGTYVALEVEDHGKGMDHDTLRRIFDPFFTTKATGRGLGLAAVLGIVRGHGGGLSVTSQPGRGTEFSLVLPTIESPVGSPAPTAAPATQAPTSATVLVIDDEESVRESISDFLGFAGMRVLSASGGAEGLEIHEGMSDAIDLVILDLSMPEMSGEETLKRLQALDPGVQVLLSSGYDESEVTRRFAGTQIAGFIQKPYRPEGLVEKVRDLLPQSAATE